MSHLTIKLLGTDLYERIVVFRQGSLNYERVVLAVYYGVLNGEHNRVLYRVYFLEDSSGSRRYYIDDKYHSELIEVDMGCVDEESEFNIWTLHDIHEVPKEVINVLTNFVWGVDMY